VNAPNLLPEKVSSSPSVIATRRVVFAPVRASPDALSKHRKGVQELDYAVVAHKPVLGSSAVGVVVRKTTVVAKVLVRHYPAVVGD
jgi:hypothetical protein